MVQKKITLVWDMYKNEKINRYLGKRKSFTDYIEK